jgi:hypothetical protein
MRFGARAALSAATAALFVTGCATVLGLGADADYVSAAKAVCQCSASYDLYASGCEGDPNAVAACAQERCTTAVDGALRKASAATVAKWLDTFGKESCDSCVATKQVTCVLSPPVCKDLGAECDPTRPECCGALDSSAVCLDGKCQRCVASGQACTRSEECCGYPFAGNSNGYSPPYCDATGHCRIESPTCKKSGETCGSAAECCGDEAGLATCDGNCHEACVPGAAVNCPGCCGEVLPTGEINKRVYECLDKRDVPNSCATLCDFSSVSTGLCAGGSPCGASSYTCVFKPFNTTSCERTCP